MKKKQEEGYRGVTGDNKLFFSSSLEAATAVSKIDPIPVNRKSRRVMRKTIQEMSNDNKQEHPKTPVRKTRKGKQAKSKAVLSKRLNRAKRRKNK